METNEKTIQEIMSTATKSFMKVKDSEGNFVIVTPITKMNSVMDEDGKNLDIYLKEVRSTNAKLKNDVRTLYDDTDYLHELYNALTGTVDPMVEKLNKHLEDFGDEEENIFNHLYEEIDGINARITEVNDTMMNLTELISRMSEKLDNSINNQLDIGRNVSEINSTLNSHMDEIPVELIAQRKRK